MKPIHAIALLLSCLFAYPALAIERNIASQEIQVQALDRSTGGPKTGDAANITVYVSIDGDTSPDALTDTSATELSSTNAPGVYQFDLTQGETNGETLVFTGKSTTSNIDIVPVRVTTMPAGFSTLTIASNRVNADAVAVSGSTTAADDLEDFALNGYNDTTNFLTGVTSATSVVSIDPDGITSDSIANGAIDAATFSTGAIDNAAFNVTENVNANVEAWNATSVPAEHTAGYPVVTIKDGTGVGEIDTNTGSVVSVSTVSALGTAAIPVGGFATGAITADAIATGAVGNDELNVTETLTANPASGGIVAASFGAAAIDNAAFNVTETLVANPATGGIVSGSFAAGAIDNAAMNVTEVLAANVTQIGGSAPNATALAEFVTGSRGPLALHTIVSIADTASSFTIIGGGDINDNWNGATVVVRDNADGSIGAVQTIADSTDAGGNTTLTLSGPLAFTPGVGDFVDIIASASSSSGGITAQEVRDAMKLAPSGGAAASGSIDYQLDALPTAAENTTAVWASGTRSLTDKVGFALSTAGVTAVASAVADTWDGAEVALTPEALAAIANSVASQDVSGYTAGTLGYESALRSVLDQAIADAMKSSPAAGAAEAGSVQDKLNKTYNAARSR